jgi:uncharacterized protein YcfL
MKKLTSIFMAVATLSLVACGSTEEAKVADKAEAVTTEVTEEVVKATEETVAITEEVMETVEEAVEAVDEHVHAEGEGHSH